MFRMRIFYISLVNVILVGVKPLVRYAAKWKSQNSPKPAFLIKDEMNTCRVTNGAMLQFVNLMT